MIAVVLKMRMIEGTLQVTPIPEEAVYTRNQLGELEIVRDENTMLHMFICIIKPKVIMKVVDRIKEMIRESNIPINNK